MNQSRPTDSAFQRNLWQTDRSRLPLLVTTITILSASVWAQQPTPDNGDWFRITPPTTQENQTAAPAAEEFDTLTRGPMHEAFGAATGHEPMAGRTIQRQPPEEVDELPATTPDELKDQNPIWISGYWAWDEEREDFIWISGAWRIAPQGREWIPGYWTPLDDGWQWISGYWSIPDAGPANFVQRPPATLESGPSIAAPSDDHFWIPGNWLHGNVGWAMAIRIMVCLS